MHGQLINPKTTGSGETHYFGMAGYPTVAVQVQEDINDGSSYTPQVSIDGKLWAAIKAIANDGTVVTAISSPGIYRLDVNGYQSFRLLPSAGFVVGVGIIISVAGPEALRTSVTP